MRIDCPRDGQIPQLRALWQEAFGDDDAFLDDFFRTAFSPCRCRCITENGAVTAALYIFDCLCGGMKIAYVYAVAVAEARRGRGLCRMLMEDTHRYLHRRGYGGVILVPGSAALFRLYERFGYRICSRIGTFTCTASADAAELHPAEAAEYAAMRRHLLPAGGVVQEGENLTFLQTQAELYAGDGFVLAAQRENAHLRVVEYLGDSRHAAGIVRALGCSTGEFRTAGEDRPFAMFLPLVESADIPSYFGLAFD